MRHYPNLQEDRQYSRCPALLGHTKLESTVRHLAIEADDALAISEQLDP
jgi:hypothetical protein